MGVFISITALIMISPKLHDLVTRSGTNGLPESDMGHNKSLPVSYKGEGEVSGNLA